MKIFELFWPDLGFWLKEYSVEIYEWSGKTWEPYVTGDVQVQFYMMSPYVLKTLSTDNKVWICFLQLFFVWFYLWIWLDPNIYRYFLL